MKAKDATKDTLINFMYVWMKRAQKKFTMIKLEVSLDNLKKEKCCLVTFDTAIFDIYCMHMLHQRQQVDILLNDCII